MLLHQALYHMLDNAWKFSSLCTQPHIEIGQQKQKGQTLQFIRDNGVGYNEEYKEKLFLLFQRLHSKQEFEGLGIGLATAHRIITMHNGQIWGESKPNQGATFFFRLEGQ